MADQNTPSKSGTNDSSGKPATAPPRKSYTEHSGGEAISALLFSEPEKKTKREQPKGEEAPKKSKPVVEDEPETNEDDESDESFEADDESDEPESSDDPEEGDDADEGDDDEDESDEDGDEEADDDVEEHADLTRKVRHPKTGESLTLGELFNGYLRTADYTRKTQAAAKERKEVEEKLKPELESIRGERVSLAEQLKLVKKAIEDATPQEPNWDTLRSEDPDNFPEIYAAWDIHKKRMADLEKKSKDADEQVAKDNQRKYEEHMREQNALLIAAMPGWDDPTKAKSGFKVIADYATSLGWTEDDVNGVTDHRLFLILDKARKWDVAQKKAKGTKAPTKPPAKPGSSDRITPQKRKQSEYTRDKAAARKSGGLKDAARAIKHLL